MEETSVQPLEEKKSKKDINFQDMPIGTDQILSNETQNKIFEKFTKEEPIAIPLDQNYNTSHLALILSPNFRELELMIRGLEYCKRTNPITGKDEVILRKIENHPLNEYGINKILELIKIWSSSELKLGRRTPQDAISSAQQIGMDARRLIYKNLKNFGMDNQQKQRSAKLYTLAIFEFSYSALTRSISGMENDASRPTEYSIQSNMLETQNELNKKKRDELKN